MELTTLLNDADTGMLCKLMDNDYVSILQKKNMDVMGHVRQLHEELHDCANLRERLGSCWKQVIVPQKSFCRRFSSSEVLQATEHPSQLCSTTALDVM